MRPPHQRVPACAVGKVSRVGVDYIALLVLGVLTAAIHRDALAPRFRHDRQVCAQPERPLGSVEPSPFGSRTVLICSLLAPSPVLDTSMALWPHRGADGGHARRGSAGQTRATPSTRSRRTPSCASACNGALLPKMSRSGMGNHCRSSLLHASYT